MKKLFTVLLFTGFIFLNVFLFLSQNSTSKNILESDENENSFNKPYAIGDEDDPQARFSWEFKKLRDPVTNRIPDNIRQKELEFAAGLPKRMGDAPDALTWSERGPSNVGGRTRAVLGDINDTNIIIAGGVSGGIWRSTNSGVNWTQRTTLTQLHSTTCIAQDIRTGNTGKWYMGTGERAGNSAGQFGAAGAFTGDGVFKSIDNGLTWNLLASTSGSSPSSFNSNWQYVWNVATDASNATDDEVYAATIGSIQRSTNGGTNWTTVLGNTVTVSEYTDVKCATSGVVYAAGSYIVGGPMNGIYRSADGVTWANITPGSFPATFGRIVVAIAPSNQNIVYFAVHDVPNAEPNSVNGHQLWKYQYVSGDGTGAGGIWTALGGNLPQAGQGNLGTFNEPFDTQGGYDLTMQVSPTDPNFVILGGVNLYRSTDGFATSTNTKRIGGYQPQEQNGTYPNSHPDIHIGYFKPGSSSVYFSGHDGGISRTDDIAGNVSIDNPVTWFSRSGSFNVTQFYAISLDPENGSNWIAGGFQDNGSSATNSALLTNPWGSINSGDGGYCSIPPLADDRLYSTSQNGDLDRVNRDGSNMVSMKPTGLGNPAFINPHILDPNNSSIVYYGGGTSGTTTGIWRNNNIINGTATVGWSYLAGTDFGVPGNQVSAVSVSKANTANVVYYGTDGGFIRRIDNANTTATVSANLNSVAMPAGFVSCLAIDPTNSNNVIAVFSNYNVQRLWYSTDAGSTWTNIDGNLAGANGPSCRWATILYKDSQLHVFLATSVGVYYTLNINGASTVWTQEAVTSIGNVVTVMFDYRSSDNVLVAATHGRGSFSTVISAPLPVELLAFNSQISGSNVSLTWSTGSEVNNRGFDIQRKTGNEDWNNIGFVNGNGNSNVQHNYSFNDNNLQSGKYKYRLKQTDYNGNFEYYNLASEVSIGLPSTFVLKQNYPNPFNPSTKIEFSLPSNGNVMLKIYDISGKEVARLINNEFRNAGNYTVDFNASTLASGVYFYRLEAGSFIGIKKMMFVK
ncbi:MAG: T9SS type A sorting domain-containing protein [Bacteroidetes bacterium]|nr:T9SS type A sorting domain-containing protein [Bacteroidota bacterium]